MILNIGVVGIGKIGICYSILFAKADFKVYIYDINSNIINNIKNDTYNYTEPELNNLISKYKSNLNYLINLFIFI